MMQPFDVYSRYDVTLTKGKDCFVWDAEGKRYLDFYGGHAVISIGHGHPHFIKRVTDQLDTLAYYSNAVKIPLQFELAEKLGQLTGLSNDKLFLVNSGAEAVENALKLASFVTGRKKIVAFKGGFHGRTSLAVQATDNPKIQAPVNKDANISHIPLNDESALKDAVDQETACVIVEGIQGVGGLREPTASFWKSIEEVCKRTGALLVVDEIQSGSGRTGSYFAHQKYGVRADITTMAKGIGNGFPVGALIIHQDIDAVKGQLGTTYGGNPLACAAFLSVLEVIESEDLMRGVKEKSEIIKDSLASMDAIKKVWGEGLMLGFDLVEGVDFGTFRSRLLNEGQIITGFSPATGTIRLLPPLTIKKQHIEELLEKIKVYLS